MVIRHQLNVPGAVCQMWKGEPGPRLFIQIAAHSEEGGFYAELTANVKTVSHWAGDTFSACHYISHMEAFADSTKTAGRGQDVHFLKQIWLIHTLKGGSRAQASLLSS